jgi:hypothetical protein
MLYMSNVFMIVTLVAILIILALFIIKIVRKKLVLSFKV